MWYNIIGDMMKKFINIALRFVVILIICILGLSVLNARGYDYKVTTPSELKVNNPIPIEIETIKDSQLHTAYKVDIDVFNKYNKNETFSFTEVPAYEEGKYLVVFTPQYSGGYVINLSVTYEQEMNPTLYQVEIQVK